MFVFEVYILKENYKNEQEIKLSNYLLQRDRN